MGYEKARKKGFQRVEDMTNYTVRRHGKQYKVYENATKQYVVIYRDKFEADDTCKKLNSGSGFAGNTPRFFTRECPLAPI